ncbi:hypothetical protein KUTeg_011594 [Tegillarca granosa]|uniref:Uncharacterized protein n=1 Tax=Tegillarca granosa TaxID=220873 RepID=A0ABQ9EX28_TEGGR|nr:hypothetical protein KUTeg_011594 [Tegillarca granosa]
MLNAAAENYGIKISTRHLKRRLSRLNLRRRQYSNLEDVVDFMKDEVKGPGLHIGSCSQNVETE